MKGLRDRRRGGAVALLVLAWLACSPSGGEDASQAGRGGADPPCTRDADCPEGSSCWHRMPRGPSAGVRGSPQAPGRCVSDTVTGRTD
jgi:hypothetical protein